MEHRVGEIITTPWGLYKSVLGSCRECQICHLCGVKALKFFGVCSAVARTDNTQICWIKVDKEKANESC